MTTSDTPGPGPGRRRVRRPSAGLVARHGGRAVDPATSARLGDQDPPRPTAYVADRLVVLPQTSGRPVMQLLEQAAERCGAEVVVDDRSTRLARSRGGGPRPQLPIGVTLRPRGDGPARPPDAWEVLQTLRSLAGSGEAAVGLDHLLFGTDVSGEPFTEGHGTGGEPFTEGHGSGGYTRAGGGGRQPVTWVGGPPARTPDAALSGRRPVVAVLDTGCGEHDWLRGVVRTDVHLDGVPAGLTDAATDPEDTGDVVGPLDGVLDSHAGHGTFIAGLVRQICPDADVLAVRVMSSDGVVRESDLLHALGVLAGLAERYESSGGAAGQAVDVVVLSLGYYHESPEDASFDVPLLTALETLGRLGVAVVAAAGNAASTEPMYPAAFAPHAGGAVPTVPTDRVPVTSVAATNPDGSVALFSNAGSWVSCWQPGAGLVSTMPTTFRGSRQPSVAFTAADGSRRATLDPDDFRCGFGIWSGTSFAAPVAGAAIAQRIWDDAGRTGLAAPHVATATRCVQEYVAEHPLPRETT